MKHSKKINKIKLSIFTTTYNRSEILKKFLLNLENHLKQNKEYIEYIISDNGSTDNTTNVINDFIKRNKDIQIKFYKQEENIGAVENIFFLLDKLNGEYIFHISDDDIILDNKLKTIINEIDKSIINKSNSLILCRSKGIYEWEKIPQISEPNIPIKIDLNKNENMPYVLATGFSCTVILKRSIIMEYKKNAEKFSYTGYGYWALALYFANEYPEAILIDTECVHGNALIEKPRIPYYEILIYGRILVWQSLPKGELKNNLKKNIHELVYNGWKRLAFPVSKSDRENTIVEFYKISKKLGFYCIKIVPFLLISLLIPFNMRLKIRKIVKSKRD